MNRVDRITRNSYDLAGELLQVQQGYLTPLQQNYATYTYSPNGRRTSVTDANGNRADLRYDGFDRLRYWVFPSRTVPGSVNEADYEEYRYDLVGNRTSLRKRDGLTLDYHYDALDRMTNKIVPPRTGLAATHTRDVFYDYNLLDLQTFARFDSATGEGIANSYDAFGRLLSSTSNMDGVSRAVTRSRDDVNNRTSVTYGGQTYVYDYDDASRLEGVYQGTTVTATALLTGFTYTPLGQVALRNGKVSSVDHDYDAIGRLTSMAHAFAGGAGNVTFGLPIYNPASQIERRTRSNDAYAWNGGVEVNRPYTVNALNQYTAVGGVTFASDANGNLTSDGSNTYTYDVENRLVAVSGARTANLRYDPLGRLYEIGAATPSRRFVWDGDALVAEYQTITGTPLAARFVHGAGEGVDDPLIWFGGGENRRLHTDHQGSVVAITNGSGTQTWLNGYDEWGIPNMTAGAPANTGRFQYTGQTWIGELGMYHYKSRIYSPTLGRFLQTDSVGYDGGINLYAYVGNDPINGIDPAGTCDPVNDPGCISDPGSADDAPDLPTTETPPEVDTIVVTGLRQRSEQTRDDDVPSNDELPIVLIGDSVRELASGRDYTVTERRCTTGNVTSEVTETAISGAAYAGATTGGHLHRSNRDSGPGPDDGHSVAARGVPQYVGWGRGGSFGAGKVEFRSGAGFTYQGLGGPQPNTRDVQATLRAMNRGAGRGTRSGGTRCTSR